MEWASQHCGTKKKKKKGHELSPKYGQIYYHGEGLWNENISCHINQQEISQPSVISDVNKGSHPLDAATPDSDQRERSWRNTRSKVNNEAGLAPESWGARDRNEFSEPRGLRLPIHRMLNSLTGYLIFNVQTACFLCCKLVYSLTFPLPLGAVSQSYWDAVSPARSPKHSH